MPSYFYILLFFLVITVAAIKGATSLSLSKALWCALVMYGGLGALWLLVVAVQALAMRAA